MIKSEQGFGPLETCFEHNHRCSPLFFSFFLSDTISSSSGNFFFSPLSPERGRFYGNERLRRGSEKTLELWQRILEKAGIVMRAQSEELSSPLNELQNSLDEIKAKWIERKKDEKFRKVLSIIVSK